MNRHFSKDDIQIASKHMKRCPRSFIIREMPIKTTMKYHFTPTRTAIINKDRKYQRLGKTWRTGTSYVLVENVKWHNHLEKELGNFLKS